MKAHDLGLEVLNDLARRLVEGGAINGGRGGRGIQTKLAVVLTQPRLPCRNALGVRLGRRVTKEVDVYGLVVRCRMMPISVRTLAASRIAQGSEPSPPASLAAIAIADPFAPAMGA